MRQVITFLGKYHKETTYLYRGQEYKGQIFAQALREFVQFDRMLVFVTKEAKETTWQVLEELHDQRITPVSISVGEAPDELWTFFDRLVENVEEKDTLIFDITHGLRSISFLVFLAAAYLKTARNVTIEAIYYGAYELGQPAPVIDLSEFVSLLDWLTATNQFIHTGDARYLASRLKETGEARNSDALKQASKQLEEFSLAMMLCRPMEVMEKASGLGEALSYAENDLKEWARPFNLLSQRINTEYKSRAVDDPYENVEANLKQQYRLILWYLENNQIIQAVTLAREWIISGVGWRQGRGFLLDKNDRRPVETQLGRLTSKEESKPAEHELSNAGLNAEEIQQIKRLWSHLTTVRNDLDHAGMSRSAKLAQQLAQEAQNSVYKKIRQLAKIWGVEG